MRLDIAGQTDVGRRKNKNEDSYGVVREGAPGLRLFREGALLCVADGLGGHVGGEIASKLAVSMMRDVAKETLPPPPEDDAEVDERDEGPLPLMRAALEKANESIYQTNQDIVTEGRPMGTTVLAALILPGKTYIANVGDSRCYHVRDGEMIARTVDHSWVDEQVKQGLMSKAEAALDRRKNVVTRCVGTHADISVDTYCWHIVPGDILLLCTDGLVNMATDQEILEVINKQGTAADFAQRLVHLANENGGKDNITVLLANISPGLFRLIYLRSRTLLRKYGFTLGWALFLILYGVGAFALGWFLRGA
ncbi:MAG: PP2C family protein-serine/threonine phosphatase [Candidatus Hydrogenedentota bacterium]